MYDLISLTKRNILTFLRDKTAVFFSFLNVIILLALYFLFLGKQYTTGPEFDALDPNLKTLLSVGVIMGGVLVINTVSLALGVMSNIVNDLEQRKLDGFLTTPVKRYKIVLSYYISSVIVTFTLTVLMWVVTILYVGIATGYWYGVVTILQVGALILLYTFISATLMIFLVTLIKSVSAFGAISGILGTVIGFMSGIYMPLTVLVDGMVKVASTVPFTHMTVLLKKVILKEAYQKIDPGFAEAIKPYFGTENIGFFGLDVPIVFLILGAVLFSLFLLYFAYRNLNKKMVK